MEFTKKDIIIYKKLKQKLSRDKIKKLIKNQDEFDLPDEIRSVLSKFRVQNGGYGYGSIQKIESYSAELEKKFDKRIYSSQKSRFNRDECAPISGADIIDYPDCRTRIEQYYSDIDASIPSLIDAFREIIRKVIKKIFDEEPYKSKPMADKKDLFNRLMNKNSKLVDLKVCFLDSSCTNVFVSGGKTFRNWLSGNLSNMTGDKSFRTYPNYESLQESPAFQQGYQDQMNKYLQESPEYNQGYQDGIEYLQENPNFEEQLLHEIEYYNQQVPLEENPNYVEYPQQQYPNTMETPYGDRYIINYN